MSEQIDWSKAPEGAQYWRKSLERWYRVNGEYAYVFSAYNRRWGRSNEFNAKTIDESRDFVKHPSFPAWNGEGLPPVGVVCEAAIPHISGPNDERSFIWIEGSVIAYYEIKGKTYAWFSEDDGFYPPSILEFRPIRTPEQIAADEREAAIKEMTANYAKNSDTLAGWAAYVYDTLGYRKEQK